MRKLIYISTVSLVIISFSILIFLSTVGIKTDNFNNLIIEEVKKINQKIDLDLKELNFKFNVFINLNCKNYGICEDTFSTIMHIACQKLRIKYSKKKYF